MNVAGREENEKKIMIIEDNCLTLNQIADFLSERGYKVVPCKYCEEAKELLNEVLPDLIILDIIMPDMDGHDFCRWIRSNSRLKMIPIIFLTARDSIEDKITGLKIGGDDYITKPFSMDELLARIEVILQRMDSFHELSMRDELTNSFNRRYFKERLQEEIHRVKRTGRPFSIIIADIDYFKKINDAYGHCVGDFVLVQLVRFLQNHLRRTDLVARLGGEEFVLLLPDTSSGKAFLLMERIRKVLAETHFQYNDNDTVADITLTVSAGIACCPEHAEDAESLMTLADRALYSAKTAGRNTIKISIAAQKHT